MTNAGFNYDEALGSTFVAARYGIICGWYWQVSIVMAGMLWVLIKIGS
jgi:hypothetical protein